jgi:hypothetical protein
LHDSGTGGDEAVTVVPALIIIALWVALLAPGVIRWVRRHERSTSIASFHRQLRGLEHSGPKLMEPAFRLRGEDEDEPEGEIEPSAPPRLVLLSSGAPTKELTTMRHQDRYVDAYAYGDPYEQRDEAAPWDDPWDRPDQLEDAGYDPPTRATRTVRAPRHDEYVEYDDEAGFDEPVRVLPPARARARRTRIIAGLGAAILVSFLCGFFPSMGFLWAVTLIGVLALAGYLALMFYASNTGMYGNDTFERVTPVASTVVSPYASQRGWDEDEGDDEGWEPRRVASAR